MCIVYVYYIACVCLCICFNLRHASHCPSKRQQCGRLYIHYRLHAFVALLLSFVVVAAAVFAHWSNTIYLVRATEFPMFVVICFLVRQHIKIKQFFFCFVGIRKCVHILTSHFKFIDNWVAININGVSSGPSVRPPVCCMHVATANPYSNEQSRSGKKNGIVGREREKSHSHDLQWTN